MGHGAEQVRPHFDFFVFHPEAVLLLAVSGEGAGDQRDHQEGENGQRIPGYGEVERHVGVCKHIVDTDDAQDRGDQAEEVTVGEAGDQQDSQHIDRRGEPVCGIGHFVEQITDAGGAEKDGG